MKVLDDPQFLKLDFNIAVISEILGTLGADFYMPAMILSCCCIDYMSVPLAGGRTNTRVHFKKFVSDYMGDANEAYQAQDIPGHCVCGRCALVHVYGGADATGQAKWRTGFRGGSFRQTLGGRSRTRRRGRLHLSIPHFVAEVVTGNRLFRSCHQCTSQ